MRNIFWTAYSIDDRPAAIYKIRDLVDSYGDVVDINLYSDISVNFTIEIQEWKIDTLYKELKGIVSIEEFRYLNSTSQKERTVYLNTTFLKSTGNLSIEIPAVPG
ncbi:MAG: hypothetical protein JNM21_13740 [Taibaiella sp.]|nr:hypothetical protein [Taibaiella sp.]